MVRGRAPVCGINFPAEFDGDSHRTLTERSIIIIIVIVIIIVIIAIIAVIIIIIIIILITVLTLAAINYADS